MPRGHALALILSILASTVCGAGVAQAGWLPFRVEASGEWAHIKFSPLAEFSRFNEAGGDVPEERLIRFDDTDTRGFRLGLSPHRDFEVAWTRLFALTNYEYEIDGVAQIHGDASQGPAVLLGRVGLRFDTISARLSPSRLRVGPLRPLIGLGFGWVLQSQKSEFRPPNSLPVDFSDSDKAVEATVGLRADFRRFHGGAQLRSVHWNWNSGDPKIPEKSTHAWHLGFWLGLSL